MLFNHSSRLLLLEVTQALSHRSAEIFHSLFKALATDTVDIAEPQWTAPRKAQMMAPADSSHCTVYLGIGLKHRQPKAHVP